MYLREIHTSRDIAALHAFIRENPLGVFTTALHAPPHAFIQASHIPWVLDVEDTGDLGTLRGHMARANPQAKAIIHTLNLSNPPTPLILGSQTMILFTSPHHHYISPKFYVHTKPATGKVVPTWDYAAVQVYGEATVYYHLDDEQTSAFLDAQVTDLTDIEELKMGLGDPWRVSDAPASYVNTLKKGIIGIEVRVQSIAGKYKMSQELGRGDREGVVQGMADLGDDTAIKVAEMVQERGELEDRRKEEKGRGLQSSS